MRMRLLTLLVGVLFMALPALCQSQESNPQASPTPAPDDWEVSITGMGKTRADALTEALRLAVQKATSVLAGSITTPSLGPVVQAAVAEANASYITGYQIVTEGTAPAGYQVSIKTSLSQHTLRSDFGLLSQSALPHRWLVLAEPGQPSLVSFANGLRVALGKLKQPLVDSASLALWGGEAVVRQAQAASTGVSGLKTLAAHLEAAWLLWVKKDTLRTPADPARALALLYDASNGSLVGQTSINAAFTPAQLDSCALALLQSIPAYLHTWLQDGIPYEVRLYGSNRTQDFTPLLAKVASDPLARETPQLATGKGFCTLRGRFLRTPDQLADFIIDQAYSLPSLAARKMDIRQTFGRFLALAPAGQKIAELDPLGIPTTGATKAAKPTQSGKGKKRKK